MQFQYNADYPGLSSLTGEPEPTNAQPPHEFPSVQPIPCARITTRVYHPIRNQIATVKDVLVRTVVQRQRQDRQRSGSDASSMSSSNSSSSSSSSDDSSMLVDDGRGNVQQASASEAVQPSPFGRISDDEDEEDDRAYWIQRTIRDAIYGRVLFALILRRRTPSRSPNDNAEWEVTDQFCAVKEMSWQHIRRERDRLAEDPIKEVSAMQYLKRWHSYTQQQRRLEQQQQQQQILSFNSDLQSSLSQSLTPSTRDGVAKSFQAIRETNIMMPLDLLSDDGHLYSIMPYCDGGELFERLDMNERFSEAEARYWMKQVLNGLENLQHAGICHRDMSLENLLVHESGALIIDMGMCLRVPTADEPQNLSTSMQNMTMNGLPPAGRLSSTGSGVLSDTSIMDLSARYKPRYLIQPQGTCGKWIYMSPEIYKNREPFDGFAVDLWAAGVILFLMLTGFPPWERACQTDERFKYMSAGYLVQMLTEWEIGISPDAMDLLQRMLFLDPKDRLSLDQVRAHPWMLNGPSEPPTQAL